MPSKIHFMANGVFTTSLAGGDFHFLELAKVVADEGFEINYFGGHALKEALAQNRIPGTVTLTDDAAMGKVNQGSIGGQWSMFRDFYQRYRRTMQLRSRIAPEDFVYAVSDYWFDVVPVVRSAARRKLMILHMRAPTLGLFLKNPRPAALHYFLSQNYSLKIFRRSSGKLLFIHPNMQRDLLRRGFPEAQLDYISAGCDVKAGEEVPPQPKEFDVVWIGRVHPQKGTDDLVATLAFLAGKVPDFKAVLMGRLAELKPRFEQLGILKNITFADRVSEAEKFRLLKASRMFLLPSRYEGSGSSAAREAIVSSIAVVAYELDVYRPVFGNLLRYVPPIELAAFQTAALETLLQVRAGKFQPNEAGIKTLKETCAWEAVGKRFVQILRAMPA